MAELKNRSELEADAVKRLGWLSEQHRKELREQLGTPPDAANVPESFWEKIRQEHEAELLAILALIMAASAVQHGLTADQAATVGQQWAVGRAAVVAQDFVRTTREKITRDSQRWRDMAARQDARSGGEAGASADIEADVEQSLESSLGKKRAERIAVTETTMAQHAGGEQATGVLGTQSDQDRWITERDDLVCPICGPLDGTPRRVWGQRYPAGPPSPHPNCRCYIQYVAPVPAAVS